jgi:DNA-binding MarR family transcriptional regulator
MLTGDPPCVNLVPVDDSQEWRLATAVLRLATQLVDGIQAGVAERGYTDVRPAHGFAFVRIAAGPTSIADLAEHLGTTKQAASQLVAPLVARGYVTRHDDPTDGRAQLLSLTARGRDCTAAARQAAVSTVQGWQRDLPADEAARLVAALDAMTEPGPLRPAW